MLIMSTVLTLASMGDAQGMEISKVDYGNFQKFPQFSIVSMVFHLFKWTFQWKWTEISTCKFPKWKFPFLSDAGIPESIWVDTMGRERTIIIWTHQRYHRHFVVQTSNRRVDCFHTNTRWVFYKFMFTHTRMEGHFSCMTFR